MPRVSAPRPWRPRALVPGGQARPVPGGLDRGWPGRALRAQAPGGGLRRTEVRRLRRGAASKKSSVVWRTERGWSGWDQDDLGRIRASGKRTRRCASVHCTSTQGRTHPCGCDQPSTMSGMSESRWATASGRPSAWPIWPAWNPTVRHVDRPHPDPLRAVHVVLSRSPTRHSAEGSRRPRRPSRPGSLRVRLGPGQLAGPDASVEQVEQAVRPKNASCHCRGQRVYDRTPIFIPSGAGRGARPRLGIGARVRLPELQVGAHGGVVQSAVQVHAAVEEHLVEASGAVLAGAAVLALPVCFDLGGEQLTGQREMRARRRGSYTSWA